MNSEQIDEKAVFNVARQIDQPEAREAYLSQVCGGNDPLIARVQGLLDAYEQQASFLESPATAPSPTVELPVTERAGDTIGPYKLLQQIGEGGMGVVYMAEQTEPIERRVALKIIKPGMDTRQVIARFEAERQALAMMDHPHIAKVLDAGTTETGRPYFVMELVKGVPITEYCDEHHLTLNERLKLFVPVCQAIQHAHQKGIIHRDIKPSNVLVAEYDDTSVAKVIDFGVAKAVNHRLTEKTMFTEFGQVLGTIEYMSPEQAKLNQWDVDTRTDVYSLGVLLYELLSGEVPFDRQRLRSAAFDELLRIIREEEPPKPSTRASTSQSLLTIAANRKTEPKHLTSTIHGELDWIVMKALDKDRSRRYETASKFAEDLQHFLAGDAVEACPPSAAYRLRKFARRNIPVIVTLTAVATALLVGTGLASWQAIRATSERNQKQAALEDLGIALREKDEALETATVNLENAIEQRDRADANQRMALSNIENLRIDLSDYAFFLVDDEGARRQLQLIETSVLSRDTNDTTPQIGAVYLWVEEGRPRVILDEFMYLIDPDKTVRIRHEVHSLSEGPLAARYLDKPMWNPKQPGVEFREVPGAPKPAPTADARLSQMRDLAAEFMVRVDSNEYSGELELQPEPFYRYGEPGRQTLDGALFGFFHVADLETVLLLESRGETGEKNWSYAFAAMTGRRPSAEFRGETVWTAVPQLSISWGISLLNFKGADDYVHLSYLPRLLAITKPLLSKARSSRRTAAILSALGRSEEAATERDEAIETYKRVLRERPNDLQAIHEMTEPLLRRGRFEESALRMEAYINEAPRQMVKKLSPELLNAIAWGVTTKADPSKRNRQLGLRLAELAVELAPESGSVLNTLGVARYYTDDMEGAVDALNESMARRNGGDSYDWFVLAMAEWRRGEEEAARRWYDRAVDWMEKKRPDDRDLRRFYEEAAALLNPDGPMPTNPTADN